MDADDFERVFGVRKGVKQDMELIKELRRLTGWTIEEMAEHLGVSDKTVSYWGRGKASMRKDARARLESLLADLRRKHGANKLTRPPKGREEPQKVGKQETRAKPNSNSLPLKGREKVGTPPREFERLPKPNRAGGIYNYKDSAPSPSPSEPHATRYGDKPGAYCARCTYRDTPFVGGRGEYEPANNVDFASMPRSTTGNGGRFSYWKRPAPVYM